jgi:hypothetical protein
MSDVDLSNPAASRALELSWAYGFNTNYVGGVIMISI